MQWCTDIVSLRQAHLNIFYLVFWTSSMQISLITTSTRSLTGINNTFKTQAVFLAQSARCEWCEKRFFFFLERWQSSYIKVMNYLSIVCHINLKSTCESSERCAYLFRSDTKQVKIAFLQLIAVTGAYIMTDAPGLPFRSRQEHRSRLRSWLWHPDFFSLSPSVFSQACEPRPWGQPALFFFFFLLSILVAQPTTFIYVDLQVWFTLCWFVP